MSMRKRVMTVVAATTAMLLFTVSAAFAHVCFVPNKAEGAGVSATATLEICEGEPTFSLTSGDFKGGFLELDVLCGGESLGTYEVLNHKHLSDGAHNAGPGDDGCDGVGVDDAEDCIAALLGG